MGDAFRIVGFTKFVLGDVGPTPLHSGSQVLAIADVYIGATKEWVTVEGANNLEISWSGDLGSNPRFGNDITGVGHDPDINELMQTSFAPGTHTFEARGAEGGRSIT